MGIFNQNVLCQGLCSQEPVWSEGRSTLNRFSLLTCLILCHTENFLGLPESSGKWGIGSGTKCEAEAPGFNWAREEKLSFQATPWNITHLPALSRRVCYLEAKRQCSVLFRHQHPNSTPNRNSLSAIRSDKKV